MRSAKVAGLAPVASAVIRGLTSCGSAICSVVGCEASARRVRAARLASAGRNRRRAVGVERLDRLQPPRLALLALFLGPHDRLPVWCQDQAGAGLGDFDAVAAGLVDVEEEGLLDRVLVRAGFDVDAVLQKNVGGTQDFLAAVERIRV